MATFLERLRGDPARVRLDRLERLQALTEELSAAQTRDDVMRVVLERGLDLVDASAVALLWERGGELELLHAVGLSEDAVQRLRRVQAEDATPVTEAYRTSRPVWLATPAEIASRYPSLYRGGPLAACAAIPLGAAGSRGVAGLEFRESRAFDEEERGFILAVARQCTNAMERARLFDASSLLAERLRQLLSAASVLSTTASTPPDVAAAAFRALGPLGACAAEIHAAERDDRVALLARHGRAAQPRAAPVPVDAATPAAEVVRTGRAVWLESPEEIAERYPVLEPVRAEHEEGAWAVVPLLCSGHALGALAATFPEARKLTADERTFLRLVAQPCAQALERRRLVEEALRARGEAEWTGALLSGLSGMVPVGIALVDRDMRFLRVNENFSRAVGVSEESCVGRTPFEVLPRAPREKIEAALRGVLETGVTIERELEAEVPSAPGVKRVYTTTWFPVRVHGEVAGVGVLVRERR